MSDHRRPTQLRRRAAGSAPLTQASLRGLALRPMLGTGVAASAAWAAHQAAHVPLSVTVSSAVAAWLGLTVYGVRRADAALAGADVHLENLVSGVEDLRTAISEALERAERGGDNGVSAAPPEFTGELSADPSLAMEQLLFLARAEVDQAIGRAAQIQRQNVLGERAQTNLLRTIAQRQNALVTRALDALDKAENSVEDPDILNDFFGIDHLVTQLRRSTENIAVLGGQGLAGRPREPLPVATALRQAVEEIERYDRVQVAPAPDKLSFPGHVGPSVVHLLAELLENAARFSDSRTIVQLTATEQQGGLVIAVRDRGMSMEPAQLYQLNEQLAAPRTVDVYAHLKDGRIGLVVTGQLAQRCGIQVQLQANTDGAGVTAFALIPNTVLMTTPLPPAQSAPAPPPASVPYQARPELSVHQGHSGRPQPAGAPHPVALDGPTARQHTAEAPTEGRAPLPRRPATEAPGQTSGRPASAQVTSKGPTPGLLAQYRAGAQQAAIRRTADE
jgi:signal transduction histidine kinase